MTEVATNGQLVAADARRKLELFCRSVVQSPAMQASGGMLGMMLGSAMPMLTTMLERAKPETVAQYSGLLSQAFGAIADPDVSEEQFAAQLAAWTPPDK